MGAVEKDGGKRPRLLENPPWRPTQMRCHLPSHCAWRDWSDRRISSARTPRRPSSGTCPSGRRRQTRDRRDSCTRPERDSDRHRHRTLTRIRRCRWFSRSIRQSRFRRRGPCARSVRLDPEAVLGSGALHGAYAKQSGYHCGNFHFHTPSVARVIWFESHFLSSRGILCDTASRIKISRKTGLCQGGERWRVMQR